MRIAMRDLEIRGAGSLMGAEQSGNMSAVGFDLFAQMLGAAVNATREGDLKAADALPPALSDITVNVPGHTYLPEEYVPDADERVLWYRKIASAATVAGRGGRAATDLAGQAPRHAAGSAGTCSRRRASRRIANEHHIKTVSVVGRQAGGGTHRYPARQDGARCVAPGGRYLSDKRKLQLPLKYFRLTEKDNLFGPVAKFLREMNGEE